MMRVSVPPKLKPIARGAFRIWHAGRRVIRYPYYFVGTSRPVWFHVMNREGRALFRRHAAPLDGVWARAASDLHRHGIALTHVEELFPGRSLLDDLRRHAEVALATARTGRKKGFLRYAWRDSADALPLNLGDPLIRLAIEPKALGIINAYMGIWSKLDFYSLAATVPVRDGTDPAGSQRWHRDPGDPRILKLFLYLTDVLDLGAGPFCFVRDSHEGGRWRGLYPPRPDDGFYPPPGAIEERVPGEDITVCLGRAGTIILCDTTGLHRGGYSTTQERIMFTAGYSAKWSLTHPIKYRYPERFDEAVSSLAPIQRYAVDNR